MSEVSILVVVKTQALWFAHQWWSVYSDGPKGEWSQFGCLKKSEKIWTYGSPKSHDPILKILISSQKANAMGGPFRTSPAYEAEGLTEGRPQLGVGELLTEFLHFFLWSQLVATALDIGIQLMGSWCGSRKYFFQAKWKIKNGSGMALNLS